MHLEHQSGFETSNEHLHGATIIDESGNETPITEEMIQDACKVLLSQH